MDSQKLNDWMQVLGIFALVGSLIFVGLQMQQTQEIAIASHYQSRAETTMNLLLTAIEADYLPVPDEALLMLGIRDLDTPEIDVIERSSITVLSPDRVRRDIPAVASLTKPMQCRFRRTSSCCS